MFCCWQICMYWFLFFCVYFAKLQKEKNSFFVHTLYCNQNKHINFQSRIYLGDKFCISFSSFAFILVTITYKSRLTQKKWHKKTDAIFSIHGKNGIIPWHFFQILSWAFRGCWGRMTSDGEILRLRPQNFAIIPETLAPQLKKVR